MNVKIPDKESVSQLWDAVKEKTEDPSSDYVFGHGFEVQGKLVSVKTVSNFNGDNTLPMTAVGVLSTVGNIEALLSTI